MVIYAQTQNEVDLRGILALQQKNLRWNLTEEQQMAQGFLSLEHDFDMLNRMHQKEPHTIAKDESGRVVAYFLTTTVDFRAEQPLLVPLFDLMEALEYAGKPVSEYRYLVMGQVCVDIDFRSSGVFVQGYSAYRDSLKDRYDLVVTEIALKNTRSLRAHLRVGFEKIHRYTGPDGVDWVVVLWLL